MNAHETVFPTPQETNWEGLIIRNAEYGLTKREYAAIEMMKANIIADPASPRARLVEIAIQDADALLSGLDTPVS